MSTDLEEIKDSTELNEEETPVVYDDIKKWNAKVVTPVIVLTATLFIAVYTYFKHYPVGVWIRVLVICVCIFLVMGSIVERMIAGFVDINYDKAVAERREAEKREEEARAAMEAEALRDASQQGPEIIQDEDVPTQF
ncbi:MAG: hypothetical protein IJJ64_04465 [Butyrivibrio sp.]|jgi:Na+-transporting methylmalonyl-CoA/oxaloacetate decarboxylase gamma subunit|nr:hypothetical protein [Butyrivibrio sp.]MBQ6407272.1 hypothetical protein [Butyrivibrio sp.]